MKKLFIILLLFFLILFGGYQLFPGQVFALAAKAERAAAGLEHHTIAIGDLHFAYLDSGEGEPIVLLHGFGTNKDNWTRLATYLTPHYRVIAPDLSGFGESSQALNNDYRVAQQAKRLHIFMQALKLDKVHLGGSSMGGYIAGVYAADYPEWVSSLLLVSPSGVESADLSEMHQLLAQGKPNPLVTKTPEDYDRLLEFVFVKPPFIPQPIKNMFAKEASSYQALHEEIAAQLEQDKLTPPLEALQKPPVAPTLIVWGDQDRVLDVSGGPVLAATIPGSELEVMTGVGHLPMIERPEATAKRYLEFLQQHFD